MTWKDQPWHCLLIFVVVLCVRAQTEENHPQLDPRVDKCLVCMTIAAHAKKIYEDEEDDVVLRRAMEVYKYITDFNQYAWRIIVQHYWDPIYKRTNIGQSPHDVCASIQPTGLCGSER